MCVCWGWGGVGGGGGVGVVVLMYSIDYSDLLWYEPSAVVFLDRSSAS